MKGYKTVSLQVTPLKKLFDALPEDERTPEVRKKLQQLYPRVLETLVRKALSKKCREPQVSLNGWRLAGNQLIAGFWVSDMEKEWTATTNFIGQNVGQCLYAGAIVVQDGDVRTRF